MNKVQQLDELMKQFIMDAEDDSILNQIFPLYKTFSKEERKEKFVKDMSDDEFDDMLQQLMEERKERKRKREKDFEM